jgi:integrase/recombinase XerD
VSATLAPAVVRSAELVPLVAVEPAALPRTFEALIPIFLGWFKVFRRRSGSTLEAYGRDLQAFAAFACAVGADRPERVNHRVIEAYIAWQIEHRGRKVSTANRHRYAIGQFFRWLVREGVAPRNPIDVTFALKQPKRLPGYLTIPEQERVLAALAKDHTPAGLRNLACVALGLLCGLRVSELATVRLVDVDLEAGVLRVIGKGDKQRECVIVPRLAAILRAYLRDARPRLVVGSPSPWLIVNAHRTGAHRGRAAGQLLTRSIFVLIHRVVSPLVGRDVHPHMLRHSFASRLREHGADLQLIQEALGHEDIRTTTIYAHITTSKRRQDVAKYLGVSSS